MIHGDVFLSRDVEALVVDPSFFLRGDTGPLLKTLSETYGFPLFSHHGFKMPDDFRGLIMPSLAARVAYKGRVDVQAIGEGVRNLVADAMQNYGQIGELSQKFYKSLSCCGMC